MLIHSYLTDGKPMFEFALLFLESFKYYHGEDIKIVFSARNLRKNQLEQLYGSYSNLDIINERFGYKRVKEKTGFSNHYIDEIKSAVENGINISGKQDLITMKQFISVDDRYRNSILDAMNRYRYYNHMLHLDIDI